MGRVWSLRLGLRSHGGGMSGSEAVRPAWGTLNAISIFAALALVQ